jgi:hypothetical protein
MRKSPESLYKFKPTPAVRSFGARVEAVVWRANT